jgi:hypothetical protein
MKKHASKHSTAKKLKLTAESLRVLTLTHEQLGIVAGAGGRLTSEGSSLTNLSSR